jgi:hypothetical protein
MTGIVWNSISKVGIPIKRKYVGCYDKIEEMKSVASMVALMSHAARKHQSEMNAIFGKFDCLGIPVSFPPFGAQGDLPQIA